MLLGKYGLFFFGVVVTIGEGLDYLAFPALFIYAF